MLPYSTRVTMQDAAVATGNGNVISCQELAMLGMQVTGTFVGTVTFEATVDGTNWVSLECMNVATGAKITSVSGASVVNTVVVTAVAGLGQVRARVSAWTSGSITVKGFGTALGAGLTLADIDIAGQEDMNVAQVGGTAVDTNSGSKSAGSQRVVVATDDINLAAINAVSGTTSGAAVVTDADGTKQQYLRGLVKLIAAKLAALGPAAMAASMPVVIASDQTDVPVAVATATTGGCSIFRSLDLDESEEAVKANAGTLYGGIVMNMSASVRYLKFYNATVANVTVGTTVPVLTIPIPTQGDTNGAGFVLPIPAQGIAFATAITVAATTGLADADSGAPGANEVVVNLWYS